MIIQCPDCQTKMRPTPPADTPEGTRVSITCRCGTVLRFRMPGRPKRKSADLSDIADALGDLSDVFQKYRRPL